MKRMSKNVKREFAQLLPTSKRLKMIQKRALERLSDVCNVNNECYELMEKEKEITGGYHATSIIMIGDNIRYITKYTESLSRMQGELAESCKEIKGILNHGQGRYVCPLFLRWRFKRMLYVGELLGNIIDEMCNIHNQISEDFKVLFKNKMTEIEPKEEN